LRDRAHWEFELLVGFLEMIVFDGLVIGIFWPIIRKHWQHHLARDKADAIYRRDAESWPPEIKVTDWSLNDSTHVKVCPDCESMISGQCIQHRGGRPRDY